MSGPNVALLRCPHCARREGWTPKRVRDRWLVCSEADCGREDHTRNGVPAMMIEDGERWRDVAVDALEGPSILRGLRGAIILHTQQIESVSFGRLARALWPHDDLHVGEA